MEQVLAVGLRRQDGGPVEGSGAIGEATLR